MQVVDEEILLLSNIAAAVLKEALNDSPLSFPCISYKFCLLDTCEIKLEWFNGHKQIQVYAEAYTTSLLPNYKPQDVACDFISTNSLGELRKRNVMNS